MARTDWTDLLVITLFVVIAVAILLSSAASPVLLPVLALPLVFIVPGYALTAMLFPERDFQFAELLAYSLGLSLVADILGGLVLNFTALGLNRVSWTMWLGAVTLTCSFVATFRRSSRSPTRVPLRWSTSLAQGLVLGLSLLTATGAIMIAREWATQPSDVTELWVLPNPADGNMIQFGVRNLEDTRVIYRLEVEVGNDRVLQTSIDLPSGETWARSMVLTQPQQDVQVVLYLEDNPTEVYRQVALKKSRN